MGMSVRILLVEDVKEYHKVVARTLRHHEVECVESVDEALARVAKQNYDLILLDLSLPEKDGHAFLAEFSQLKKSRFTPVICLTGKNEIADKVTAFSLGADDYIVKPFEPDEFRARVDAKVSRHQERVEQVSAGFLTLDSLTHRAFRIESEIQHEIALTPTEFKILHLLIQQSNRVLSREQLQRSFHKASSELSERAIDVHVCSIRKKIVRTRCFVESVPGVGYKLVA